DEPQGAVRRRQRGHVRGRKRGALRVAPREPRGRVPPRGPRQLARPDRPEPAHGDAQRRPRRGHPGPGHRRHDRGPPVLRDRGSRRLRPRPGARARGLLASVPALDGDRGRRGPLADRPLVRRGRGDHDAPPPGGRDRHRARGRGAAGQDDPPAGRGAGGDSPPGLSRRAPRGRGARLRGPGAVPRPALEARPRRAAAAARPPRRGGADDQSAALALALSPAPSTTVTVAVRPGASGCVTASPSAVVPSEKAQCAAIAWPSPPRTPARSVAMPPASLTSTVATGGGSTITVCVQRRTTPRSFVTVAVTA